MLGEKISTSYSLKCVNKKRVGEQYDESVSLEQIAQCNTHYISIVSFF
jgi:hypothetical protein